MVPQKCSILLHIVSASFVKSLIDDLVQDSSNYITNALELLEPCTKASVVLYFGLVML